jgi:hypothetical protein
VIVDVGASVSEGWDVIARRVRGFIVTLRSVPHGACESRYLLMLATGCRGGVSLLVSSCYAAGELPLVVGGMLCSADYTTDEAALSVRSAARARLHASQRDSEKNSSTSKSSSARWEPFFRK